MEHISSAEFETDTIVYLWAVYTQKTENRCARKNELMHFRATAICDWPTERVNGHRAPARNQMEEGVGKRAEMFNEPEPVAALNSKINLGLVFHAATNLSFFAVH